MSSTSLDLAHPPLVDVIIPFFNRIPVTCRAVKSVLAQTYENINLILVNDCSTEDILPVLNLCFGIKKCQFLHHDFNQGASISRNTGLLKCSGEYIAFLDSDDYWHPYKLEIQISFMKINNYHFTYSPYIQYDPLGNFSKVVHVADTYFLPAMAFKCKIATPTVIIHSSILKFLNFPTDIHYGEDILAWCRISMIAPPVSCYYPLAFVCVSSTTSSKLISKQRAAFQVINTYIFKSHSFLSIFHFLYYNLFLSIKTLFKR